MSRGAQSISRRPKRAARPRPKASIDIDGLAARRGVQPVADFDKLLEEISDAWPEGEDVDQFIAAIRAQRREGGNGR